MTEYDTTEKVEKTDKGFRLVVESTRGTGTRDEDKVKLEARTETLAALRRLHGNIKDEVEKTMEERRGHLTDTEE